MLDAALTSIFGSAESLVAGVSTVDFLLCCLASIVLGAAVAGIYMFRHTYSKSSGMVIFSVFSGSFCLPKGDST